MLPQRHQYCHLRLAGACGVLLPSWRGASRLEASSQEVPNKRHTTAIDHPEEPRQDWITSYQITYPTTAAMPLDYSKWDALELSDDSDVEVHPNVDKRSFIRAKQNQIHQERLSRKHRITTLKYERVINDGLLARIDALLKSLDSHKAEVESKKDAGEVDEVVFDALMDVTSDGSLGSDNPPHPPENVHTDQELPSYSKMMGTLVDQVRSEIDKSKAEGPERYAQFVKEVKAHQDKVNGLQRDLNADLTKQEKLEAGKITSESIHEGFNSSYIAKPTPAAAPSVQPELLNPGHKSKGGGGLTSGAEADIEDGGSDDDADIEASATAKRFAKFSFGDYAGSLEFIGRNPGILSERETDGLLVEAFNAQSNAQGQKSQEDYARQCVHQALLLQYCRQLGKDGVGLFFKRIQTPGHQARKLFLDDVNTTYARIRSRTAELAREQEADGSSDKEQIQLHAVDPNTQINIVTPPPADQCTTDEERAAREIFDSFPPGLQRALASESLDEVNKVLGKMSVDEAEQVVEQLGNGGMLSLEEGVIDATTEEGQKAVEELEKQNRARSEANKNSQASQTQEPVQEQRETLAVDELD
jgi:cell division cycle protein 37